MSCILFTLLPAFIFSFLVHLPLSDVYVFISQTVVLYYKRPALEIVWPLGSASKQAELNVVLTVYETTMKKKKTRKQWSILCESKHWFDFEEHA